jgi:16S rRNA (cytosine967-C5)-methyltransferase
MKNASARTAAFDVLLRVETERAFSSVLLDAAEKELSPRDRSLCHELVMGTLRRQIYLDAAIDHFSAAKKMDAAVLVALRLGLYQLFFLDKIPDHSAVNESIGLVKRAKKTSAAGFVNAILRRATRETFTPAFTDELDQLSTETSHPRWLLDRWIEQFGDDEARSLAQANNEKPRLAFRPAGAHDMREQLAIRYQTSQMVAGCYIAASFDSELRQLAASGDIYFQDEASQLVAHAVPAGERLLDICAAPGSKTSLIASLHRESRIFAGDLHIARVDFLRRNCERQHPGRIAIVQYDAERPLPFADETFDTVLVDAPCSGTGTIRHNPEIRYFVSAQDIADLSTKQLAMLNNASKLVKPGGTLVYSTCSLEREENEAVSDAFLQRADGWQLLTPMVSETLITNEGHARTFPHREGMDGFFIAMFGRGSQA